MTEGVLLRPKWFSLMLAGVILAAMLSTFWIWLARPFQPPPYAFLSGKPRVARGMQPLFAHLPQDHSDYEVYSWKGEFADVSAAMMRELKGLGYDCSFEKQLVVCHASRASVFLDPWLSANSYEQNLGPGVTVTITRDVPDDWIATMRYLLEQE